jgi:hypothetical protein
MEVQQWQIYFDGIDVQGLWDYANCANYFGDHQTRPDWRKPDEVIKLKGKRYADARTTKGGTERGGHEESPAGPAASPWPVSESEVFDLQFNWSFAPTICLTLKATTTEPGAEFAKSTFVQIQGC